MTPIRLVDGQELQAFSQGNGRVAILKTLEDRFVIKFGSTVGSAIEVFSVSNSANDVVLASGVDLLFDGAAATIGGNIPSSITLGKAGDTINLNAAGVTYNFPTSGTPYLMLTGGVLTGNLVLDKAELHFNSASADAQTEVALKVDGEDFVIFEPEESNREWLRIKDTGESDPTNAMKLFGWNVWHTGNLTPSNYLPLAGGTLSGSLNMNNNTLQLSADDYILAGNASYSQAGIWISSGQDIAFNINSNGAGADSFQVFEGSTPTSLFQIRTDLFKYKTYDIWHSGNFNPASKSDVHSHPYMPDTHDASAVTSAKITSWDAAYAHSQASHARTDATLVQSSLTNGNIKINGTETTVYTHPTDAGNKHIPAAGASGNFLKYSSAGTATWSTPAIADITGLQTALDGKAPTHTHPYLADSHAASGVTTGKIANWDTAYTHSQATHARTDATLTQSSSTNGNIKINGTEITVYTHPSTDGNKHIPSGGSAGQFVKYSSAGTGAWATPAIADISGLQTALDGKAASSHNHSAADINAGVLPASYGGTGLTSIATLLNTNNTLDTVLANGNTSSNTMVVGRYLQQATGVPTANIGSPSLAEMALFQQQFDNKTWFYPTDMFTFEYTNDGTTWINANVPASEIKKFVSGYYSATINIPNGCQKYRIQIYNKNTYVYVNALYIYASAAGHSTKIKIRKRDVISQAWSYHTNSESTVGGWPAHWYLPFAGIPWSRSASTGMCDYVEIEFTPVWNATYPSNVITLYNLDLWGGYPAGTRSLFAWDGDRNATFPAQLKASELYEGANRVYSPNNTNIGTGATNYAAGNDSRFHSNANDPTSDQKAALAGTSGTPSSTNKYVTNGDSRLSNSRTPTAHKSTHASGGSDQLTPADIGAAPAHTHPYLSSSGGTVSGDLTITGNLTISGTSTTINTETINLADNIIVLNSNFAGTPSENAGMEIERGTSANVVLRWNETADIWEVTKDGTNYYTILDSSHAANGVTSGKITNWDAAYTHSQATHARTDATLVQSSATNGNIKINGAETTVYTHPSGAGNNHIPSGGAANQFLQYSASGVAVWSSVDWSELSGKPSTFAPSTHTHAIADTTGLQDALNTKSDVHTHPYLSSSGGTITGDLQLDAANNDRYIVFNYTGSAGFSWRLGYIGTGSGDANYFAIDTSGEDGTWARALEIGLTSKKTDFKTTPSVNGTLLSLSNHTHSAVTTSVAGFMSAADKTKLDGIATNANNYSHPTGDGNLHVPATSTTNNLKVLKAGATAGSIAWSDVDWAELTGKPSTFAPSAHTHTKSQITDWSHEHAINIGNGAATQISLNTGSRLDIVAGTDISIAYDDANDKVTISSSYSHPSGAGYNHIPSGGAANQFLQYSSSGVAVWSSVDWSELSGKPSTFAPATHSHAIADTTGLQAALDGKAPTHTHPYLSDSHAASGVTTGKITNWDTAYTHSQASHAYLPLAGGTMASNAVIVFPSEQRQKITLYAANSWHTIGTEAYHIAYGGYHNAAGSHEGHKFYTAPSNLAAQIGSGTSNSASGYTNSKNSKFFGTVDFAESTNTVGDANIGGKATIASKFAIEYNEDMNALDFNYIG